MGELDGVDERREIAHPVRLPLLEVVVVEDADELRLERLDLRLHARQRRGRGIRHGRVHVLVELGAVAAERVDEHVRADELVLGHLDCVRASVVRRVGLERRRLLDPNGQLRGHRRLELHALEGHRLRRARRDRHRLRFGDGRGAEHQGQRRRRARLVVQLLDVGDDVDSPRREGLLWCVDGCDDEVGPKPRDRVAPQDRRPRRLVVTDVHLHVDLRSALDLAERHARDALLRLDILAVQDARRLGRARRGHPDLHVLEPSDRRAALAGRDRDPDVASLVPGQRPQLEYLLALGCAGAGAARRDGGEADQQRGCLRSGPHRLLLSCGVEQTMRPAAHAALTRD